MIKEPETSPLPTVLDLLRETPAGEIYFLADKETVAEGFIDCAHPVITGIAVRDGGQELAVKVGGHAVVTIAANSGRLVASGNGYHRAAQVVSVMAVLKRVVTPGSLGHVRFSERHLAEVALMLGLPPPVAPHSPQSHHDRHRDRFAARAAPRPPAPVPKNTPRPRAHRLVLFEQAGSVGDRCATGMHRSIPECRPPATSPGS